MKLILTIFFTLCSLSVSLSFADTPISDEKKALIDSLLQQTSQSADDISDQIINNYIQQITSVIKQSEPDISETTLQEIIITVTETVKQQVVDQGMYQKMIYPIYDQHFTEQELQKMIVFNQTEFGQKLLNVMPLINGQHQFVASELSLDLAPAMNERILGVINKAKQS